MQQKGTAIKGLLAAIARLHGASGLQAVLGALSPDVRAQVAGVVLPVQWYDVRLLAAIHVAVRDTIGKGDFHVSHALGREAARLDFTGIYRVVLRAVQYDTIWDRVERVWGHYNSQGEGRWLDRSAGSATGIVTGVEDFNEGQWHSIAGRCEQTLLMAGAKGASVEATDMTPTQAKFVAMYLE